MMVSLSTVPISNIMARPKPWRMLVWIRPKKTGPIKKLMMIPSSMPDPIAVVSIVAQNINKLLGNGIFLCLGCVFLSIKCSPLQPFKGYYTHAV